MKKGQKKLIRTDWNTNIVNEKMLHSKLIWGVSQTVPQLYIKARLQKVENSFLDAERSYKPSITIVDDEREYSFNYCDLMSTIPFTMPGPAVSKAFIQAMQTITKNKV